MDDADSRPTGDDEDIERFRTRRRRGSLLALGAILGVAVIGLVLYFALAPGPCERFATRTCEKAGGPPELCEQFRRLIAVIDPPASSCEDVLYAGDRIDRINPHIEVAFYGVSFNRLVREGIAAREQRGEEVPQALRDLLAQLEQIWEAD